MDSKVAIMVTHNVFIKVFSVSPVSPSTFIYLYKYMCMCFGNFFRAPHGSQKVCAVNHSRRQLMATEPSIPNRYRKTDAFTGTNTSRSLHRPFILIFWYNIYINVSICRKWKISEKQKKKNTQKRSEKKLFGIVGHWTPFCWAQRVVCLSPSHFDFFFYMELLCCFQSIVFGIYGWNMPAFQDSI